MHLLQVVLTNCLSKPLTARSLGQTLQPMANANKRLQHNHNRKILPIKILAVDDNEANLKLIKALLLRTGERSNCSG